MHNGNCFVEFCNNKKTFLECGLISRQAVNFTKRLELVKSILCCIAFIVFPKLCSNVKGKNWWNLYCVALPLQYFQCFAAVNYKKKVRTSGIYAVLHCFQYFQCSAELNYKIGQSSWNLCCVALPLQYFQCTLIFYVYRLFDLFSIQQKIIAFIVTMYIQIHVKPSAS